MGSTKEQLPGTIHEAYVTRTKYKMATPDPKDPRHPRQLGLKDLLGPSSEQQRDPLRDARLPAHQQPTSRLRSVPEAEDLAWDKKMAAREEKTWDQKVAEVDAICPMRTPTPQLRTIQARLLAATIGIEGSPTTTPLTIEDRTVYPQALAQALKGELNRAPEQAKEVMEAAVQLYLQGSYGKIISPYMFNFFRGQLFYPGTSTPRRGVHGDAVFAHTETLLNHFYSENASERAITRALFDTGTVAHLCLWARGTNPEFISRFMREALKESRTSESAQINPLNLAQFVQHLLPYLVESGHYSAPIVPRIKWLDFRDPKFQLERAFMRGVYIFQKVTAPLRNFIHSTARRESLRSDTTAERPSIPRADSFASLSRAIPKDYLRMTREEVSAINNPWEVPGTAFAERLRTGGSAHDIMRAAIEYNERRNNVFTRPSSTDAIRWFFPSHFFKDGDLSTFNYGSVPEATEIPRIYHDMILARTMDDAFAFSDIITTLKDCNILRDEDDLIAILDALQTRLFADSDQNRFKVASYACELIRGAMSADCISPFDVSAQGHGEPRFMAPHDAREIRIRAGLMAVKAYTWACVDPRQVDAHLTVAQHAEILRGITAKPFALAALMYWMTGINAPRTPRADPTIGEAVRHVSREMWNGLTSPATRIASLVARPFLTARHNSPEAQAERRRARVDAVWGEFFERLKALEPVRPFADEIKEKVTKGALTAAELSNISEFFKTITSMPCPTQFLFLHFRAARLGFNIGETFPVWERLRLPGIKTEVAFNSHDLRFRNLNEFKQYVRTRSSFILLNQDNFQPENECDIELLALACRLYRNGVPAGEVKAKTLRALVPDWLPTVDGEVQHFNLPRKMPSLFDEVINQQDLPAQRYTVERNTGQSIDDFRKRIGRLRAEGHKDWHRFEAQQAALARVSQLDPDSILTALETKYGVISPVDDKLGPGAEESVIIHQRVMGLVNRLNTHPALEPSDAALLFFAHATREHAKRRDAAHLLGFEGELERWGGLLEFTSEGLSDPLWGEVMVAAAPNIRGLVAEQTDVAYLERELLPLTQQQPSEKKKAGVPVQFALTRGPASRLIGSICDTCALETLDHHDNMAFVTFSQHNTDGPAVNSFQGGSILICTWTKDGEPALVIRGFNPQLRLLKKVGTQALYDTLVQYVAEHVARPLGIRQILAPYEVISGGAFTNRPLVHLAFKSRYRGNNQFVDLVEQHSTRYNDRDISDHCIRVWQAPEQ